MDYLEMTVVLAFECVRRYQKRGHLTIDEKQKVLQYIHACLLRCLTLYNK